ncbi:hypothetical protein EJ110_NYTH05583 [Nymphaea thermarum]|nr:hypothetical protein EJ110_NYTH05583 [Nymphaea thermarum]
MAVLVIDLGGGTVDGRFEVKSTAGGTHLGAWWGRLRQEDGRPFCRRDKDEARGGHQQQPQGRSGG